MVLGFGLKRKKTHGAQLSTRSSTPSTRFVRVLGAIFSTRTCFHSDSEYSFPSARMRTRLSFSGFRTLTDHNFLNFFRIIISTSVILGSNFMIFGVYLFFHRVDIRCCIHKKLLILCLFSRKSNQN